jgi:hypothetical protein
MILSEALGKIKTIFLDTAPVIYFIEAHHQFGPHGQAGRRIDE